MNLTENEKKMLDNIVHNNFACGECRAHDSVWAYCLDEGPHGEFVPRKSFCGIVSSLVKKGLAYSQGKGKDTTVSLTDLGVKEYKELERII
jgi:hypothetical protein